VSWLKLTDEMGDHRKVRRTIRAGGPAGLAAFGLHILGMLHSARYLTDGEVEREFVDDVFDLARLRDRDHGPVVERLERNGLWVPADEGGWRIHDYLEHNPSRADVEARRRRDAERKAAGRAAQSTGGPSSVRADTQRTDAGHSAESDGPVPSRPIPNKKASGGMSLSAGARPPQKKEIFS
jgi:hypothetical protein